MYDLIIVGGACAGLTAGLYAGRRSLKTLILTRDVGGQAAITTDIENYPGTGAVRGPELMNKFREQAEAAGAEIKLSGAQKIEKTNDGFAITVESGERFESLAVILAFGLSHRHLGLPKEKELIGRGVTYCATCDGPLFKNKVVAVVGGGNSAFDAADYLASIADKVYLLARSDQYRAEKVLLDSVKNNPKVEIRNFTEVAALGGEKKLENIVVKNSQTGKEETLDVQGLFVEIGYETQTDFIKDLVELNERGFVKIDHAGKTSCPGIFAAGDVTETPYKQAIISAGEGAVAALAAAAYVQNLKGESAAAGPDWIRRKK